MAVASWRSAGVAWCTLLVATACSPTLADSRASASLRAESSGSPWSHSSTKVCSAPNAATNERSSRSAAAGPRSTSAAGTVPLRHPVSTAQCPRARPDAASATAANDSCGRPFSPAICASDNNAANRA